MVSAIAAAWALFGVDRSRTRSPALLRLSEALNVAKRSSAGWALPFPSGARGRTPTRTEVTGRAPARPATTRAAAVAARDRRVGRAITRGTFRGDRATVRRLGGLGERCWSDARRVTSGSLRCFRRDPQPAPYGDAPDRLHVLGTGVAMLLTADLGSDGYSTFVNGIWR